MQAQTIARTKSQKSATQLTGRLAEVADSYQRILLQNPCQPEALVGMSLVALASRQNAAAVSMASAAVAAAPEMCAAWVALGQALKAEQRYEESEQAYRHAIRLEGANPFAHMARGELKIAVGAPQQAILEFKLALKSSPSMISAHLGLGNSLAFLGRNEQALARYEAALAVQPHLPEAEFAAGFALARLGRTREAETRYRRALVARPDFAAAWINLGSLLREQGRDLYAGAALTRATQLRPDLVSGWVNLAILAREQSRPAEAEAHLRRAFALKPAQLETLIAWCQFRAAEQDLPGAWGWLRWALAQNPDFDEAQNMYGILLHLEARFKEAIDTFERAEALGNCAAASNRGNSLLDLGRMDDALHAHQAAVATDPQSPGARYNLALTQLRLGQWQAGWANYEARWRFREVHRTQRTFLQPRWRGEQLRGERVLLHAEQGLGDTIQFCRYAALVAARGGVPVLQIQPAAERLMRSLAVARAGLAEISVLGTKPPQFDLECPLLSLPAVFHTLVDTVPWEGAYLGADPGSTAEKWAQFPGAETALRIGLAWAGNPRYKADHARSVHLQTLLPLLRAFGTTASNATLISLQKGPAAEQLAELPRNLLVLDGCSHDRDLAETAALMATLDLVITTDTCIAHLAGAMAKPVWVLLPKLADWRWMQQIETSPWYPTARLFRQRKAGDWDELLSRVIPEFPAACWRRNMESQSSNSFKTP